MTKARWGAFAISVTGLLASGGARAQGAPEDFGASHQVVVSGERLFGFVHSSQTTSNAGANITTTVDSFSLVGNTLSVFTLYEAPRLAVDFFVVDHLSVGGSFTYFHTSESESVPAGQTVDTPTLSGFSLAPRVGYALPLGSRVSLWPRLGFTLVHLSESISGANAGAAGTDTTIYALTVEAPFAFMVAPHFFLTVAPTLDVGLGGSTKQNAAAAAPSVDAKETDFGVLCGIGGYI